jgi:hypothetical protein
MIRSRYIRWRLSWCGGARAVRGTARPRGRRASTAAAGGPVGFIGLGQMGSRMAANLLKVCPPRDGRCLERTALLLRWTVALSAIRAISR